MTPNAALDALFWADAAFFPMNFPSYLFASLFPQSSKTAIEYPIITQHLKLLRKLRAPLTFNICRFRSHFGSSYHNWLMRPESLFPRDNECSFGCSVLTRRRIFSNERSKLLFRIPISTAVQNPNPPPTQNTTSKAAFAVRWKKAFGAHHPVMVP